MSRNAQPAWSPSRDRAHGSELARFIRTVSAATGRGFEGYAELHRWSVECPDAFWPACAEFTGMHFHSPWASVLDGAERMPGARWFTGAKLNFAENLLAPAAATERASRPAIIFGDETGRRRELSFAELESCVAASARGLRRLGIGPGDRVAALLPNQPETVIIMLAAAAVGAVFSSCSPDFGIDGVVDRFGQIRPRVLFVADGYHYGGRQYDTLARADEIAACLDGLESVVIVPFVSEAPSIGGIRRAMSWTSFIAGDDAKKGAPVPLDFESLPFDHPLYILFSSGTTGAPKCIVHGAGGTLLQHLKEHALHTDITSRDRLFYFTTCGWMMWNWLVSALARGAAIVLYDGSPFHPDPGVLWRLAADAGVTVFGTGAKYLSALEKRGFRPRDAVDTDAIVTVLSTGSPLAPASYDFVYDAVSPDVLLASISGGTDLIGCFAAGNPMKPVWRGELQCAALGMAVDVFDDAGRSLGPGKKGELVCTRPFPTMPLGFWNDDDGSRYREAYFERFPGAWAHGDYAEKTTHGGLIIHGRSDAVLNAGGVRIGTAEIYRQVEKLPEILESVAIAQARGDDSRIVLFVVLRAGLELDEALQSRIRETIRRNTSPRHVPAKIVAVAEIPRTRSGKIVELAVRAVVHGDPVENVGALANPDALENFRNLPELDS